MSLKSFHIVFVTVAVTLSFLTGYWGFGNEPHGNWVIGLISSAMGVGLIAYGVWFWRKINPGETS